MWNKMFASVLTYLKKFKVVHKNNPRVHSPQQNIKVVLTTTVYIKISTPIR